ncbi:MAG: cysteine synthase CysM [Cryomorphaceae bacterium]|jgi:S-sulfo-L-cysteine synthase (O-acetyl-L-serine-dependent)|nr:cysteine synthase CysM [Flavobacteriaceae bacterium]NQV63579.1 cysteine synthase CysM [Cryomorphaceae bacterium]
MQNRLQSLVGNTPLVLSRVLNTNPEVQLLFKLEGQNPGGSVKDRAALNMIANALERGEINQETPLIEATSGNTGIALAMIAAIYGLKIELVMPENSTIERVQTMSAYGAKVTLTPESIGIEGARDYAENKVLNEGYYSFNQFSNPDNWKAHYKSTGPEIWRDTDGKVTHFVSSMGTTGTIMGTSTYLKEQNNQVQIVGVQPQDGTRIPGIRKWPQEYLPKIYTPSKVDTILEVNQAEAELHTRLLAKREGVFAGMSSGGAVSAALKICHSIDKGVVVVIICDRGDRYLSSGIY